MDGELKCIALGRLVHMYTSHSEALSICEWVTSSARDLESLSITHLALNSWKALTIQYMYVFRDHLQSVCK